METLDRQKLGEWKQDHWTNREWKRSLTFQTPRDDLDWFVPVLFDTMPELAEAMVQAVQIMTPYERTVEVFNQLGITATAGGTSGYLGKRIDKIEGLLAVLLWDVYDVVLMPLPARWCLVADHDEWMTVFSSKSGCLSKLKDELVSREVEIIKGYTHNPPAKGSFNSIKP